MTFTWGQLLKLSKSLFSHLQDKKDELEIFNPGCTLKSYGDRDGQQKNHMGSLGVTPKQLNQNLWDLDHNISELPGNSMYSQN